MTRRSELRWVGVVIAVAASVLWGVLVGRWMPRGPLDAPEAIWSIVLSVCVGAIAGVAMRSRWAMLVAPIAFVVAVELTRIGTVGPTTDRPAFSTYGLLALVVGRGFHALVSWLPMVLGSAWGAGGARRLWPTPDAEPGSRGWRVTRRSIGVLAAIGLVAFSVAIARPARADRITGSGGRPVAGSVAELTTVDVNGHDLAMMIRGRSAENPVLLFLAGGPGGSELGAMRRHLPDLERYFTVVTWDQRGTGRSYGALEPAGTLTLDSAVDDTIAVTDYLRDRFDQDTVVLVGQSWGSTLGVLAAQRRPELYSAYVGVGQMVSQLATDRIFYDDTLEWARKRGDDALAGELAAIGSPPYDRMLDYETALSYEHEVYPYDHSPNSEGEGGFSENFLVDEYSLIDKVHLLGAFMDTFSVLYPQLQSLDFRTQVPRLEVPAFFVQGAHEAPGRAGPFEEWYAMLEAPTKDAVTFDTSGHRPMFEQPGRFVDYLVEQVLPVATRGTR